MNLKNIIEKQDILLIYSFVSYKNVTRLTLKDDSSVIIIQERIHKIV